MTKKTLEQKIKLIGFWTFGGVFWYMVISFFLLSDYPIQEQPFNHKRAYEVIKDALGLAAAFLAPVAAFVLYCDWRDEHMAITNAEESNKIVRLIQKLHFEINNFEIYLMMNEAGAKKKLEELQQLQKINKDIFEISIILLFEINNFKANCADSQNFVDAAREASDKLNDRHQLLYKLLVVIEEIDCILHKESALNDEITSQLEQVDAFEVELENTQIEFIDITNKPELLRLKLQI